MNELTTYNFRSNGPRRLAKLDETLANWQVALVRSDIDADAAAFLTRAYFATLGRIADIHAQMAACEAKQAAHKPVVTVAAQANPASTCYKCDGRGRLRSFSHVEGGICFACNGAGVRRIRCA